MVKGPSDRYDLKISNHGCHFTDLSGEIWLLDNQLTLKLLFLQVLLGFPHYVSSFS